MAAVVDPFVSEVLSIVCQLPLPPLENDVGLSATSTSFSTAFGVAPALIECANLIRRYESEYSGNIELMECPIRTVHKEVLQRVGETGILDWGATKELCVWSLGFFINKAQINIASTLDTCINSWLTTKLGFEWSSADPLDDGVWYLGVGVRARLVVRLTRSLPAQTVLQPFTTAMSTDLWGTEKAASSIKGKADTLSPTGLAEAFHALPFTSAECAAITIGRVNAFKHRVEGTMDRKGKSYIVEVAVIARALSFVVEVIRAMREDIAA